MAQIPLIRQKYIDNYGSPIDRNAAKDVVERLYEYFGLEKPICIFADSPYSALIMASLLSLQFKLRDQLWDQLGDQLRQQLRSQLWEQLRDQLWNQLRDQLWNQLRDQLWNQLRDQLWNQLGDQLGKQVKTQKNNVFSSHWLYAYAAWFEGGKLAGAAFSEKEYELFASFTSNVSWFLPYKNIAFISDNPTTNYLDGQLHNDNGPSVSYPDNFKVWSINGVRVNEQIVMRPETQTLKQIDNEKNEEVKRIRITRYGWHRYLEEKKANPLDLQVKDGWMESLMACEGSKVLCTYDPSTGRPYALEVSLDVSTTEKAQRYLLAPEVIAEELGLYPQKIDTYPLVRR